MESSWECPGDQRESQEALTSFLFCTRVFLLVGKYLVFGGISWRKGQEGFRGAPEDGP